MYELVKSEKNILVIDNENLQEQVDKQKKEISDLEKKYNT